MPTIDLRKLLEDKNFTRLIKYGIGRNQKYETFTGQRQLIPIAAAYVMKWKFYAHVELRASVASFQQSATFCRVLPEYSRCIRLLEEMMSVVEELREVFTIPEQQIPKEEVTVFVHFLHQILEKIMKLEPDFVVSPVKDSMKTLQTELEFLITFLGDAPMRLRGGYVELTWNVLEDIRVFVNQVGSFLYDIFSTRYKEELAADRLDLALSDFIEKFELLKVEIKDHSTWVSELPGSAAIKSKIVVSPLFTVDSLLDDLKDFIDHKANRFGYMEELMLLRSSLDNIALAKFAEPEQVVIQTRDLVCEIEYVINSSPPWYLALRVPQFLAKIQLITMAIQEKNINCGQDGYAEEEYPREQVTEILMFQEETPILVGFEHTATEITEKLIGGPLRQQIISIVGMPGLGKTTLANKLFNDPSVVHHFDKRAWCIFSQIYELKNLLIDILASTRDLKRETMMQMEEDQLGEELYKSLKGMRYLIVLDDIWDVRPWDDLEKYFPDDGTGSRILFTTRNKEVGLVASPDNIIALPFLSDDECWEIMRQKLFPTQPCPQELLETGKEIAKSCRGLPLSATLIAPLLANMPKHESSWKLVAWNLSTHLLDNENNCLHVLKLSYQHLPAHLKPCFLYFRVFKEDEVIPVQKLISRWVAEGFIEKEDNKSLEDVAHSHLRNLISRGLVLISGRRSNGGIKTCIIHDLLHDMCLRIAEEENIMRDIETRLSWHEQEIDHWVYDYATRHFGPYVRSHLGRRSLDFHLGRRSSDSELSSQDIEVMINLRYLNVGSELPSIGNSNKLEYLHVGNKDEVEIPETVLKMENLRHLHFEGGAHLSDSFCLRAKEDGSFQMKNIQSISTFCIYNEMDAQGLGYTPNLRRLKCEFKNECPSFNFPNQLESLNIKSIGDPGPNFPVNLKKLTLNRFFLSWETVRMIGSLKNLEVLKLKYGTITDHNWETEEGEFQNLRFLELSEVCVADPYDFAEWNPKTDHYPKLERLVLRKCHCLTTIPSSLGYISTLQSIEVHKCRESIAKSAMEILEEQKDFGNEELKVIISRKTDSYLL